MNCEEFWNDVPAAADDETRQADWSGHLRDCAHCAEIVRRQDAVAASLRDVGSGLRRVGAPARLERSLLAAFRTETGCVPRRNRRQGGIWLMAWASAAAVLVLAAVLLVRNLEPDTPAAPVERPGPAQQGPQWASLPAPAGENEADAGDGFVALPGAAGAVRNEDLNVVRLEVPRSRLVALGFLADSDRAAAETVEAEVALGPDGLARAVRFVE
jgi:hypothetical protein